MSRCNDVDGCRKDDSDADTQGETKDHSSSAIPEEKSTSLITATFSKKDDVDDHEEKNCHVVDDDFDSRGNSKDSLSGAIPQKKRARPKTAATFVTKGVNGDDNIDPQNQEEEAKKDYLSISIPRKKRPKQATADSKINDVEGMDNGTDNIGSDVQERKLSIVDISLNELKREVLGRDLVVEYEEEKAEDDDEIRQIKELMNGGSQPMSPRKGNDDQSCKDCDSVNQKNFPSLPDTLRKDLICAICCEIFYPPVGLRCGHTFCQQCIKWWFDHDEKRGCPTCRRSAVPLKKKSKKDRYDEDDLDRNIRNYVEPNIALKTCIMAMYGPIIIDRIQKRKQKKEAKGEMEGAHDDGYLVICPLYDESWHYVAIGTNGSVASEVDKLSSFVQVRRSIVLDAEDQRMQLALAVYQKPTNQLQTDNEDISSNGYFKVQICLLSMEEDEVADSGFPVNVKSAEDELLLCGSRFSYSTLDVQMKDDYGHSQPFARVSCDDNGLYSFFLDAEISANIAEIRKLFFEHSESGLQLEIDLAHLQSRAGGCSLPSSRLYNKTGNYLQHNGAVHHDDDSEREDDEDLDEFENDGFLVNDDEESSAEGQFSCSDDEIDDHDKCAICHDGGELIICDGGDEHEGCGKSFHVSCVKRFEIPDGDWICQDCAMSVDIKCGIVGHEYPLNNNGTKAVDKMYHDEKIDDETRIGTGQNVLDDNDVESEIKEQNDCLSTNENGVETDDLNIMNKSKNTSKSKSINRRFVLDESDSD